MLWLINVVTPVKVTKETEEMGLDAGLHGSLDRSDIAADDNADPAPTHFHPFRQFHVGRFHGGVRSLDTGRESLCFDNTECVVHFLSPIFQRR